MLKWKTQIRSVNMYLNLGGEECVNILLIFNCAAAYQGSWTHNPWHGWRYNINVFVFAICRKTLKQDQGFIALRAINGLTYSHLVYLFINSVSLQKSTPGNSFLTEYWTSLLAKCIQPLVSYCSCRDGRWLQRNVPFVACFCSEVTPPQEHLLLRFLMTDV